MHEYLQISALISDAAEQLRCVSESPRLDAELLLARALDVPRSYLFAHPEDEPDRAAAKRFGASVARRLDGVPLAYITGEKEFWSMTLMVSPATLVPRPESEVLVEHALRHIPDREEFQVLDLGTGSGAIALAIAKERFHCQVTATDSSTEALAVAQQNARQLGLSNTTFLHGDWFAPVQRRTFDLIVTNPPYVPDADPDLKSLKHEPLTALASGVDGLDAIRQIARGGWQVLREGHYLLLEHGDKQQDDVARVLQQSGWHEIACYKDLAGLPRVTMARRRRSER